MAEDTPLGIPAAEFYPNIEDVVKTPEEATSLLIQKQQDLKNYKSIEYQLVEKRQRLLKNRPGVQGDLDAVKRIGKMTDQGETKCQFPLADSLYSTAVLDKTSRVALWLGANLLVEYTLEEAQQIYQESLDSLDKQLKETEEAMMFARNQITVTEVAVTRLANFIAKSK